MKRICAIFLLVSAFCGAQSFIIHKGDTINRTDTTGKKQGYWILFGSNRPGTCYSEYQKMEEGMFLNNRKNGLWKEYWCSGNKKNELTFVNGRPNGEAAMCYPNGKIRECGTWKQNRWVGAYYQYDSLGNITYRFEFDEKGRHKGFDTIQTWYDDIRGLKREYNELDEKAKRHDLPKKSSFFGPDSSSKNSDPVKLNGYYTLYDKNKRVTKDGVFENNTFMEGKAYIYDDNGILTRIAVYKNGRYIGDAKIE